jgi:7-cyano-7-deazaguanine synthase in queuosine biosynthesis
MKKEPLIVFSGGWDSTLLLHQALQEGDCAVISFEHGYRLPSREAEALARNKILDWVEKNSNMYRGKVIEHIKSDKETTGTIDPNSLSLAQLYGHITSLFADKQAIEYETIRLGLLRSDSSSRVHHLLRGHWQQMWDIFRDGNFDVPKLVLPLEHWNKVNVIEALPDGLAELVWSCNSPNLIDQTDWAACGVCNSCFNLSTNKKYISLRKEREDQLRRSADQEWIKERSGVEILQSDSEKIE